MDMDWMDDYPEEPDEEETLRPHKRVRTSAVRLDLRPGESSFVVPDIVQRNDTTPLPREDGYVWSEAEAAEQRAHPDHLPYGQNWIEEQRLRNELLEAHPEYAFMTLLAGAMQKQTVDLYVVEDAMRLAREELGRRQRATLHRQRTIVGIQDKIKQREEIVKIIASSKIILNTLTTRLPELKRLSSTGDAFVQYNGRTVNTIAEGGYPFVFFLEKEYSLLDSLIERRHSSPDDIDQYLSQYGFDLDQIPREYYSLLYKLYLFIRDSLLLSTAEHRYLFSEGYRFTRSTAGEVLRRYRFAWPNAYRITSTEFCDVPRTYPIDVEKTIPRNSFDLKQKGSGRGTKAASESVKTLLALQDQVTSKPVMLPSTWSKYEGEPVINLDEFVRLVAQLETVPTGESILDVFFGSSPYGARAKTAYLNLLGKHNSRWDFGIDVPGQLHDFVAAIPTHTGNSQEQGALAIAHVLYVRLSDTDRVSGIVTELLKAFMPEGDRRGLDLVNNAMDIVMSERPHARHVQVDTLVDLVRLFGISMDHYFRCATQELIGSRIIDPSVANRGLELQRLDSQIAQLVAQGNEKALILDQSFAAYYNKIEDSLGTLDAIYTYPGTAVLRLHPLVRGYLRYVQEQVDRYTKLLAENEREYVETNRIIASLGGENTSLAELQAAERKPAYVPSKAWILSPQISGRVKLTSTVVYALATAHALIKSKVPTLASVPMTQLMSGEGINVHFARLVAAMVSQSELSFNNRYIKDKQFTNNAVVRRDVVRALRRYQYRIIGSLGKRRYVFSVGGKGTHTITRRIGF